MSKDVNDKKAWEAAFIKPIAKVMKDRGIGYLLITLRDDGKAAYVMEPEDLSCPICGDPGCMGNECSPARDEETLMDDEGLHCGCEDAPCCGCK